MTFTLHDKGLYAIKNTKLNGASNWSTDQAACCLTLKIRCVQLDAYNLLIVDHIYQPLRSGRIWHKVNF